MNIVGNTPMTRRYRNRSNRILRRQYSGFSLIELLIVVAIIGIIAAIAIPNLAAARATANQASAIQSLRTYHSAQMTYQNGRTFITDHLDGLRHFGVDEILGTQPNNVIKSGYIFNIGIDILPSGTDPLLTSPTQSVTFPASGPIPSVTATTGPSYHIQANPLQISGFARTGRSSYYIDFSGVIHVKQGDLDATSDDPPLGDQGGS